MATNAVSVMPSIHADSAFFVASTVLYLTIIMQGVGSALPGFVHGILFCALTKEVRQTMMKGLWSGIANCEACIYDRSCGTCSCYNACVFRSRQADHESAILISRTSAETAAGLSSALVDTPSEYDIVSSPDPTSSVSIVQVPDLEVPRFATHFPDDDLELNTTLLTQINA